MWWVVPCKSQKNLRMDPRMDIEDILKMKLETIEEEPDETRDANGDLRKHKIVISKKVKKIHLKVMKMRLIFTTSELSLKESYVLFMTGLSSKGGLSALPRY